MSIRKAKEEFRMPKWREGKGKVTMRSNRKTLCRIYQKFLLESQAAVLLRRRSKERKGQLQAVLPKFTTSTNRTPRK